MVVPAPVKKVFFARTQPAISKTSANTLQTLREMPARFSLAFPEKNDVKRTVRYRFCPAL
jgi:hypothetical protein